MDAHEMEPGSFGAFPTRNLAAAKVDQLTNSVLQHALDGHRRGLKVYASLMSLNEVIGAQYGERVLFELLQNAHDAHRPDEQGEISIRLTIEDDAHGQLLVANKGRPFSDSNLQALCNIGTSDKEIGEGIGNKGLGFRSVEALTDNVHIFSSGAVRPTSKFDGYCFRFATADEIAERLEGIGADPETAASVASKIPRYLVPLAVEEQSKDVQRLAQEGYATVVCLPLASARAVELARSQVTAMFEAAAPVQLFLDRLSKLNLNVVLSGEEILRKRLARHVERMAVINAPPNFRFERVTLDTGMAFFLARHTLPKKEVLSAVRDSIATAPPLKRWLDWKGDAVVSVAVPLGATTLDSPRLFNFLPMDDRATSPMAGHIDAPFFADIDRRAVNPDLPLNKYLLQAAATTAATAALAIVDTELSLPASAVVDLAAWFGPHQRKIVTAFENLKRPLSEASIWPAVSQGPRRWASFRTLYSWPEVRTKHLTPRALASVDDADILSSDLGSLRINRVRNLAFAVDIPLTPTVEVLGDWVEAIAQFLARKERRSGRRWHEFYEDILGLYSASSISLNSLVGKKFLFGSDERLLAATAGGLEGAPPVFYRSHRGRGKRGEGPPSPPSTLARKFRFLSQSIEISDTTIGAFEKAGLLSRYDPLEALASLKGALPATSTEIQRREALIWAFRVWRSAGGKSIEEALREAELRVPCQGGWFPATQASFSGTWTSLGRLLEPYLLESAPHSSDCRLSNERLLAGFPHWPLASSDDRRDDWLRFLGILGVRDGLQPIAGELHRRGTPSGYWNYLFSAGKAALGLDPDWTREARSTMLLYPQTEYVLSGEVWRLPGQVEHAALPPSAKEALSDLIVAYLRDAGESHFTFGVAHYRGLQEVTLPTPLQIFLRNGDWCANISRDEIVYCCPRESWSTTVPRQVPPRFVPRFGSAPGNRVSLPTLLFDARVGLRDWAAAASAPDRLKSLAAALVSLSAAERRDLRDQLRRAWHDVAEHRATLSSSLDLVVERVGVLDLCSPNAESPSTIYVTGQRQGFAARALTDAGQAVLDVGETDGSVIRDLLAATGIYQPRLADSSDVELMVDGARFEPVASDSLLVAGNLTWLSDVAVLAHEYLGDALELRTLPADEFDRRLRHIRIRRCSRFALIIAGQEIAIGNGERVQAVPHARIPTLLVIGDEPIGLPLLQEAAPALTKLVGSRHNTLETMLSRLAREGFAGDATGPTVEMLARAIRRDVGVIRDYFAATRGGVERRVTTVLPIVAFLKGAEVADRLLERHSRLGSTFGLREWLANELGADLADRILSFVDETSDQKILRARLEFDFPSYDQTLRNLGYAPLNDEVDFRRLFSVFLTQIGLSLKDRLRRKFVTVWRSGGDLSEYVTLRSFDFIPFDPTWPHERENLDLAFVSSYASACLDARLGSDDASVALPPLETVATANRKIVTSRYARFASLIRAWCRVHGMTRPNLTETADPQPLVRALDQAGLMDFEVVKSGQLPTLLRRVHAWPTEMPLSDVLEDLSLNDADLEHEEREARKARRDAEVENRTINFLKHPLDTGSEDFGLRFEQLAIEALAEGDDWFTRSRPPRLALQDENGPNRRTPGAASGKGGEWRNQPPEDVRKAMGMASEWLAREYLRKRHPKEMTDDCWVSSNREAFCTGAPGRDWLGYDFRVETARHEYLYEVKSAMDEGGEFELTARELEVAGSAGLDRKRRYRILYVTYVFDPKRWRVLPLLNPVGSLSRDKFRVVRSGSTRYRFDVR